MEIKEFLKTNYPETLESCSFSKNYAEINGRLYFINVIKFLKIIGEIENENNNMDKESDKRKH